MDFELDLKQIEIDLIFLCYITTNYLRNRIHTRHTPNPRFLRTLGPQNIGSAKIEGAKIKVIVM